MALKIIDHGTKEYQDIVRLRDEILRKPLGLHFTPEELDGEKEKGGKGSQSFANGRAARSSP